MNFLKNKISLNLVLVSVLLLLLLLSAIFLFNKFSSKVDNLSDIMAEIESVNQLALNSSDTTRLVLSLKEDREILGAYFVNQKTTVYFIEKLEEIAGLLDLELVLKNVSIEEYKIFGNKKEDLFHLNVAVSGEYEDIIKFISVLETMPTRTRFRSVSISEGESQSVGRSAQEIVSVAPWRAEIGFDVLSFIK